MRTGQTSKRCRTQAHRLIMETTNKYRDIGKYEAEVDLKRSEYEESKHN